MFRSKNILIVACILCALGAGWIILNRPASQSRWQVTDDAYINADIVALSPEVSGRVTEIAVQEHETVHKDQVIAKLDDRDYKFAVAAAQAQLDTSDAALAALTAQIAQQKAAIEEASAQTTAAQANLELARSDANRYANLAQDGSASQQARETARTHVTTAQAELARSQAALTQAKMQSQVLQAKQNEASAAKASAQAALDKAKLDLDRTVIRSPIEGMIGVQSLRMGALVGPQTVACLVVPPPQDLYIDANYRETQLDHMTLGQPVNIEIDALPDTTFTGHVASIAPASGASYASLPAHNATGNFTKIVQRLIVRVSIDPDNSAINQLRAGMSVVTRVDTAKH
ncbi:HlyD family secretion protein [Thioclava sp. GXIMD4216]|uniref:HlyD family secretion protein n=1 Tax=Thioclava sp. GXIMD4216 TaxID=3131929 RepID=UPI0030CBE7A4